MSFFELFNNTANNLRSHFSYHICRCRLHSRRVQASVVQKRAFFGISQKFISGSMTLEATLLLPLYLFFFIALLSLMNMMRFQADLEMILCQSARQIAVYAPAIHSMDSASDNTLGGIATTVLADTYVSSNVQEQLNEQALHCAGVVDDIHYWQSKVLLEDDLIDLVATYQMTPLCNFFLIPDYNMVNRATCRAFTGYAINSGGTVNGEERIVYVTENGTVFHLSRSCTHLDLSIQAIEANMLSQATNQDGQTYRACEYCGGVTAGTYYVTTEGECYHSSLSCSGLKRTIYEIPISEVGDRPSCSRCGGN